MTNFRMEDYRIPKRHGHEKRFVFALVLLGIGYLSSNNYLLFHSVVEFICIMIAMTMMVIALNTHEMNKNYLVVYLGIAYGFIGGFDFLHLLSYIDMGVFPKDHGNLSFQFWIIARYIEGISLLIGFVFINRRIKFYSCLAAYLIAAIILALCILYWSIFPHCFGEGYGQTFFLKISQYIICILLLITMGYLIKDKKNTSKEIFSITLFFMGTTLTSMVIFAFFATPYDFGSVIGHLLKLISFYLIYSMVIEISFRKPYINLIKSEERYRRLVNLMPDGIFVHDGEKIIFSNPKFCEIVGSKNPKEKDLFYFIHGDDHHSIKKYMNEIYNKGFTRSNLEGKIVAMDGTLVDVEFTGASVLFEEVNALLVIVRDITQQKRTEKLQKKIKIEEALLREAKEYDKIKTEFLSTVSHEFKTPLNIILGIIQLLEKVHEKSMDCPNYNAFQKYIKMMEQNCYRLLKLINNLIDISKLDSGFLQMDIKNYNMVEVVENITLSVAEYAAMKGITLTFDTNTEEKIVACDADKIERVMLNLLSNAIKFTVDGGSIDVKLYDRGDTVVISVKDTGIGIPPDMLEEVFERFKQVESSSVTKREGSGIGLSLVKSIIQHHGGRIRAESDLGKGTKFIMELPVNIVEDHQSAREEVATANETNVERISIEFSDIYPS